LSLTVPSSGSPSEMAPEICWSYSRAESSFRPRELLRTVCCVGLLLPNDVRRWGLRASLAELLPRRAPPIDPVLDSSGAEAELGTPDVALPVSSGLEGSGEAVVEAAAASVEAVAVGPSILSGRRAAQSGGLALATGAMAAPSLLSSGPHTPDQRQWRG
jgi:hypothetical protein